MRAIVTVLAALSLSASTGPAAPAEEVAPMQSSINCGFAPFPPFGCRVGACVCDSYGQNCRWTFICN